MISAAMQSLARGLALVAMLQTPAAMLAPAVAADAAYGRYVSGARVVQLGIGKSFVVDLPDDAAEVLVADPKIANAVVRSARKAYIIGVALGETDIIFFDAGGRQIESLAVSVARDLGPIRSNITASLPRSEVSANAVGDAVMLTGSVRSASEAQTAIDIAANFVGTPEKVVNALAIEDRDQVMLKVKMVEMTREVAKQFGIRWDIQDFGGSTKGAFGSNPEFGLGGSTPGSPIVEVAGAPLNALNVSGAANGLGILHTWSAGALLANVEALESNNLLRTLAEPNLTAISGEKAEFLAGGEFPIPVAGDDDRITVEFKKFGVSLLFTPVVLSSGRISLQIGTEVSEISQENSYTGRNGLSIPGLSVRRATTTVEMPSGSSFAIAGLLRDDTRQAFRGLPGLLNLPILGSLFRSRDFRSGQTELVVIVTPYLAKPTKPAELAAPDDNFQAPDDRDSILLGRLNKIYAPGLKPTGKYRGPIGHIVE